jgi:tol-pal system protein YbgF
MKSNLKKTIRSLVLCLSLGVSSSLYAQELPPLVVDLINRVGALEEENRQLRGELDETHHELGVLHQKLDTLSADIDYRLNNPESGAIPSPKPLDPSPDMKGEGEKPSDDSSSKGKEAYEKARSLLEQGEYEAAEKAFSAFVEAHPKDELASGAQYWLGVTYFVRGQFEKAAANFAKGIKNYPKSTKTSDSLLKLAKSLAALDRKADACTTLDQLKTEHPKAHVSEVSAKWKEFGCK